MKNDMFFQKETTPPAPTGHLARKAIPQGPGVKAGPSNAYKRMQGGSKNGQLKIQAPNEGTAETSRKRAK